jgi:hypothetical protein
MANIEDILYEARELGIYEKVMERVVIIKSKNPFMPVGDVYSKSLMKEKIKLEQNKKK